NVRELENILERAIVLARQEAIYIEDLPLHLREPPPRTQGTRPPGTPRCPRCWTPSNDRWSAERWSAIAGCRPGRRRSWASASGCCAISCANISSTRRKEPERRKTRHSPDNTSKPR